MSDPRVWFITGSSSGFGRTLAEAALGRGHRVALTARKPEQVADLAARFPGRAKAIALDVTDPEQCRRAVADAVAAFGRLDVLVNNAGYGLLGALEEVSDEQIRRNLATNLLGPLHVMRAALPTLRQQKGGHIINLTAIAAFSNETGFSVYGGAKAAVEAASEAVRGEVAPLGIKVTVVVPGPFRTDFISRSLDRAGAMEDYQATVGKFAALLARIDGKQAGDPAKAAEAILQVAESESPPFRLLLGKYAHDKFRKKLAEAGREIDAWESVGLPTDFTS